MRKRNRHTGHINAFKRSIIQRGKLIEHKDGRIYHAARVGRGITIVRTK